MESNALVNRDARLDWSSACIAGLLAGAVVWLLSHGTPWFASGLISPTLMGRDLKPSGTVDSYISVITVAAQAVASLAYGLVVAPLVFRLRGIPALVLGGLIGLILYSLNFIFFHFVRDIDWSSNEWTVIVTHIVFSMIAAGTYKGLSRRRQLPRSPTAPEAPGVR